MKYDKSTVVRVPESMKARAQELFPGAKVVVHSNSFFYRLGRAWREFQGYAMVVEKDPAAFIELTPTEIQSGVTRVKWAEGLIRQLPPTHEGRNSWLLNYGSDK